MPLKRENIMIRKCIGCGLELQSIDKLKPGYVVEKKLDSAEYCERCFKVIHYGEAKLIDKKQDKDDFIKKIVCENLPIIYLLDITCISEETLEPLKSINSEVYIVLTKRDLIPKSVKNNKLISYIQNKFENIKSILVVSSTKKWSIEELYNKLVKDKVKKCYVIGHTNSGKSSLINSLLELKGNKAYITTSLVPNTTEEVMNIKLDENLTIIDTPGFINSNSIVNFIDINKYKTMIPKKEIKPKIYNLRPGFMIILEELIRIENNSDESIEMVFYLKNELNYKKMKVTTSNELKILHKQTVIIDNMQDLVIEGLGFIKFPKNGILTIYTLDDKIISKRDKLI